MITHLIKKISIVLTLIMVCGAAGLKAQTLEEAITATNNEQFHKADQILQGLAKSAPSSKIYYRLGENTMLNFFSDTISSSLKVIAAEATLQLSLIHISEPTRRTPISYA